MRYTVQLIATGHVASSGMAPLFSATPSRLLVDSYAKGVPSYSALITLT